VAGEDYFPLRISISNLTARYFAARHPCAQTALSGDGLLKSLSKSHIQQAAAQTRRVSAARFRPNREKLSRKHARILVLSDIAVRISCLRPDFPVEGSGTWRSPRSAAAHEKHASILALPARAGVLLSAIIAPLSGLVRIEAASRNAGAAGRSCQKRK